MLKFFVVNPLLFTVLVSLVKIYPSAIFTGSFGHFVTIYDSSTKYTQIEADNYCRAQLGSHLASIHSSEEESDALNSRYAISNKAWIGLNDATHYGNNEDRNYKWTDGSDYDYAINFCQGQPDDKHCMFYDDDNGGNCAKDRSCKNSNDKLRQFICDGRPTQAPTERPTGDPTEVPTPKPSTNPTQSPTPPTPSPTAPTLSPTDPTSNPTEIPSKLPSNIPSNEPSVQPTNPTISPTSPTYIPSLYPSNVPTDPTYIPTIIPSNQPTTPTQIPTEPSMNPTNIPSIYPTNIPTNPTIEPTTPTQQPTGSTLPPSTNPSLNPTSVPTGPTNSPTAPTMIPSQQPSVIPSVEPSVEPTTLPSLDPSMKPSLVPTLEPTFIMTTNKPSNEPTKQPSENSVTEIKNSFGAGGSKGDGSGNDGSTGNIHTTFIIVVLCLIGILICLFVCCLSWVARQKRRREVAYADVDEMHDVVEMRGINGNNNNNNNGNMNQPPLHAIGTMSTDGTYNYATDGDTAGGGGHNVDTAGGQLETDGDPYVTGANMDNNNDYNNNGGGTAGGDGGNNNVTGGVNPNGPNSPYATHEVNPNGPNSPYAQQPVAVVPMGSDGNLVDQHDMLDIEMDGGNSGDHNINDNDNNIDINNNVNEVNKGVLMETHVAGMENMDKGIDFVLFGEDADKINAGMNVNQNNNDNNNNNNNNMDNLVIEKKNTLNEPNQNSDAGSYIDGNKSNLGDVDIDNDDLIMGHKDTHGLELYGEDGNNDLTRDQV